MAAGPCSRWGRARPWDMGQGGPGGHRERRANVGQRPRALCLRPAVSGWRTCCWSSSNVGRPPCGRGRSSVRSGDLELTWRTCRHSPRSGRPASQRARARARCSPPAEGGTERERGEGSLHSASARPFQAGQQSHTSLAQKLATGCHLGLKAVAKGQGSQAAPFLPLMGRLRAELTRDWSRVPHTCT